MNISSIYILLTNAGMEVCYILKFKPQEIKEYSMDLVCSTEREKFVVPLRATGHRPMVNII